MTHGSCLGYSTECKNHVNELCIHIALGYLNIQLACGLSLAHLTRINIDPKLVKKKTIIRSIVNLSNIPLNMLWHLFGLSFCFFFWTINFKCALIHTVQYFNTTNIACNQARTHWNWYSGGSRSIRQTSRWLVERQ